MATMTVDELEKKIETVVDAAVIKYDTDKSDELKTFIDEQKAQLAELKEAKANKLKLGEDEKEKDMKWGFKSLADFCKSVYTENRKHDPRLENLGEKAAGDGLEVGESEEGGYLVPTEFRRQLLDAGVEKSNFIGRCTAIPMATNSVSIPYIKDTDRSGGLIFGAVKMYWTDEEAVGQATKPTLGKVTLVLKKLLGMCYASSEILEDSAVSVEPLIRSQFSDALGWTLDYELINGLGAGKPLGILNAPCLITQAAESGQGSTTLIYKNIVAMEARLAPTSETKAIWVANKDTFPQLATMNIKVGTGGAPVWLPAGNNVSGKPFKTLLGREMVFSEHCQTLGTKGDIYLADWSQYLIGQKVGSGLKFDTSMHLKFDYDQQAFRIAFRVDGQPWWVAARTPRHGSSTVSPFISLNSTRT